MNAVKILLVADDADDVYLCKRALKRSKLANELIVSPTGEDALMRLRAEGEYAGQAQPDLVLLDLNLPGIDGHQVLREIRADKALSSLTVVVLTTSTEQEDIIKAYDRSEQANAFMSKPPELEDFVDLILKTEEYWLELVHRPPSEN